MYRSWQFLETGLLRGMIILSGGISTFFSLVHVSMYGRHIKGVTLHLSLDVSLQSPPIFEFNKLMQFVHRIYATLIASKKTVLYAAECMLMKFLYLKGLLLTKVSNCFSERLARMTVLPSERSLQILIVGKKCQMVQ